MKGVLSAHSGMRYIVLLLLLIAIINAALKLKSEGYLKKDKMINLFAMIFLHIQLLIGGVLYYLSPKVQFSSQTMKEETYRFYTMEHVLLMVAAILLVTFGRKMAEKRELPAQKHQLIFRYYGLAFILIFIAIPWPFLYKLGAGYF